MMSQKDPSNNTRVYHKYSEERQYCVTHIENYNLNYELIMNGVSRCFQVFSCVSRCFQVFPGVSRCSPADVSSVKPLVSPAV